MSDAIQALVEREYAFGFHSDLDTDVAPKGLDEDLVRLISAKKYEPEWLLEWRLGAFRHFQTLEEPTWPNVHHPPIDYQVTIDHAASRCASSRRSSGSWMVTVAPRSAARSSYGPARWPPTLTRRTATWCSTRTPKPTPDHG